MKRLLVIGALAIVCASFAEESATLELRNEEGTKVQVSVEKVKELYVKKVIHSDVISAQKIVMNDDGSITINRPRFRNKTINSPYNTVDMVCLNFYTLGATKGRTVIEREESQEGEVTVAQIETLVDFPHQTGALKSITCSNMWNPGRKSEIYSAEGIDISPLQMARALKGRLNTRAMLTTNTEKFEVLRDGAVKLTKPFLRYNGEKVGFLGNEHGHFWDGDSDAVCGFFGLEQLDPTQKITVDNRAKSATLDSDSKITWVGQFDNKTFPYIGAITEITCR